LGTISGIFPAGSNDIYICRDGEREVLIPAVGNVVRTVDLDQGTMVVRLPEELDEAS
jgi:16S rRNA processing protein RimM